MLGAAWVRTEDDGRYVLVVPENSRKRCHMRLVDDVVFFFKYFFFPSLIIWSHEYLSLEWITVGNKVPESMSLVLSRDILPGLCKTCFFFLIIIKNPSVGIIAVGCHLASKDNKRTPMEPVFPLFVRRSQANTILII